MAVVNTDLYQITAVRTIAAIKMPGTGLLQDGYSPQCKTGY